MAMEYVNRKGDTYYLQEGRTKTGKPRYYCGRQLKGAPLDAVPEGYEVYEKPENGQVYLRKARATEISPMERELVEEAVGRLAAAPRAIVDVEPRALVVYLSDTEDDPLREMAGALGLPQHALGNLREAISRRAVYQKMMRFNLVDAGERLYAVQRWCFRGSIDTWIDLHARPAPLPELLNRYARHLGRESFYELI